MDKAKEWVTTLTAHLPEWCADWIPDVDQWHPADLWHWARTREWRVPEVPRWGDDGAILPVWVFPSFWRRRVRETVLWLWLIFITFLAAREERAQRAVERSQQEKDSHTDDDQRQKVLAVPDEGGEEEEDDWEAGGVRGGLERPGGLTRYPGIENLLAQPPTVTPPLSPQHPQPTLAATPGSNKQLLHKPDATQTKGNETGGGGREETGETNHQDEVWKSLLAKYATEEPVKKTDKDEDDEDAPEYVGTADEIVERYSAKFEEPQRAMSPEEEFSASVGRRLEEYLERLDEVDEESSQAKEHEQETKEVEQTENDVEETRDVTETEEMRDIEDGIEHLEGITSNDNRNRIFIIIEDDESEEERRNFNDISEGSEVAADTLDSDLKEGDQVQVEEMEAPSTQRNGLSNEAEIYNDALMETVHETSEKVDGHEVSVEQVVDTLRYETPPEVTDVMQDEFKDASATVTEEQPSDAALEEKGMVTREEDTEENVVEKTREAVTVEVVEDHAEESIKPSPGEEMKLEEEAQEQADTSAMEQSKKQDVVIEQDSTDQTSTQLPEEKAEEEELPAVMDGQALTAAEACAEQHEEIIEDVVMKEQDFIESEPLAMHLEPLKETTVEDQVVEENEEKNDLIKKEETVKDDEKETSESKVTTDVCVEANRVIEEEKTADKDAGKDDNAVETVVIVRPPKEVKVEFREEEEEEEEQEEEEESESEVSEDDEKGVPIDEVTEVTATESSAAVENIQVDDEAHFEDVKVEESKDEAMVEEEHMEDEDEEVPVARVGGWTQDVWGALGQAPAEAAPLATPAAFDMMEEDMEDVMEVDVEEELGETMEEDLDVLVDDVDLHELPESPILLPTVPEEDENLAEVQDLLVRPPPRRHRRRAQRLEEELAATAMSEAAAAADPNLAKYMTMPAALSPDEEDELRRYLAESSDAKELAVDKFMSMPAGLTEQEQKELDEAVGERERVRQAESAGLDRFLGMPVGLTEQEIRELKDLDREKEEAAEQPWEREDVGFEDYLSMPHTLTEEEERMLQEDGDDEEEKQFASEEEYREYIKSKFLNQLEEDAYRMAEEAEDDYDDDYDDDYEYEDDEDEDEDEDEDGEMEGEYVMVSDLSAASNLPQAAAVPAPTTTAAAAAAAATSASARMVDEAVNTEPDNSEEDSKSKKKLFPFTKKGDRETTPEDNSATAPQKKFFHFGSLGTKRKKETPDFLDKKKLGDPNGRKFDGGGGGGNSGGGSLSAAFCTMGNQITRGMIQKVRDQIRERKAAKADGVGMSDNQDMDSGKTKNLTNPNLTLKPNQSDILTGDAKNTERIEKHVDPKNELENVFAKIIKSYKSPSEQITQDTETDQDDNIITSDGDETTRTQDPNDYTQVSPKITERDLMISPVLDIIMEEEEEVDAELALVFMGERDMTKGGGDEEDFWLRWSNEERGCVSAARDCASPWQLAEDDDKDGECKKAVCWREEKEVKVTQEGVNNTESDKIRKEEENETMRKKGMSRSEEKVEERQRGEH